MQQAWKRVRANKGAAGIDGLNIEETAERLRAEWPAIRDQLLHGMYRPEPVRRVTIPKPDGGQRELGIGPVGEEGVENIVNAFIDAGAQSVVSTLWEVEDQATAELMAEFYSNLSRQEGKAEALRQAQLTMLKSGSPPYYWAGFELDGEPSSILFGSTRNDSSTRSIR